LYNDARNSPRLATFTTYYNWFPVSSVVLNSHITRATVLLELVSSRHPFTSMQTKSGVRSIYSVMSISFNKMCLHVCIIIPGLRLHVSNYKHSRQHWIKPKDICTTDSEQLKTFCETVVAKETFQVILPEDNVLVTEFHTNCENL